MDHTQGAKTDGPKPRPHGKTQGLCTIKNAPQAKSSSHIDAAGKARAQANTVVFLFTSVPVGTFAATKL